MHILAIETTDQAGSVAALETNNLMAARDLDPALRSAQSLAPALVELLQAAGWQPRDVQLVAVAVGPGSFTGLRVGVTTAKMFAYAVGAEVLGVNTLEVIAWQATAEIRELWAVLDAQRDQVSAGRFLRDSADVWQRDGDAILLDNDAWLARLTPETAVSGPGLAKLLAKLPPGVTVVERHLWYPKATTVGRLAWRDYQAGRRDNLWSLAPQYFRMSAAEEKRAALGLTPSPSGRGLG